MGVEMGILCAAGAVTEPGAPPARRPASHPLRRGHGGSTSPSAPDNQRRRRRRGHGRRGPWRPCRDHRVRPTRTPTSEPGSTNRTPSSCGAPWRRAARPWPGQTPARIAFRSPPSTRPSNRRRAAPRPSHFPGASPLEAVVRLDAIGDPSRGSSRGRPACRCSTSPAARRHVTADVAGGGPHFRCKFVKPPTRLPRRRPFHHRPAATEPAVPSERRHCRRPQSRRPTRRSRSVRHPIRRVPTPAPAVRESTPLGRDKSTAQLAARPRSPVHVATRRPRRL